MLSGTVLHLFLWLLPLRQVATLSSRCESVESVMSVESVHLVREVLWDAMGTRHDWLGIFTALVQDYLSENSLLMVKQSEFPVE